MSDEPVIDGRTAADEPVLRLSEPTFNKPVSGLTTEPVDQATGRHQDGPWGDAPLAAGETDAAPDVAFEQMRPAATVQSVETPMGVHLVKMAPGMTEDEMRAAAQTGPKIYRAPVVVE